MKFVFTGGHHTSALVVARELKKLKHQVFWFGHRSTMVTTSAPSIEYQEVTGEGIPFYPLISGKPVSYDRWWFLKLGKSLFTAFRLLRQIKPDLIVAWGGYLAVPVVSAGWLLRVPTVLHEQARIAGRANRLLSGLAKRVMVTWPDVNYPYPQRKTVVVGLPLRPEISKPLAGGFEFTNSLATILVLGGKQGSRAINQAIFTNLQVILKRANLIHQCGLVEKRADFQKAKNLKTSLAPKYQERYQPYPYLDDEKIGQALHQADLLVSRAGAHITYEILKLAKPALLIPLEIVPGQEQFYNAELLAKVGLGEILIQKELTQKLAKKATVMIKNLKRYQISKGEKEKLIIDESLKRVLTCLLQEADGAA
jgi:UDP-N-acetylglucosamine--N-acetylmuramyl-(pentapeptide) pyrophosphoryl-undecaprenol N-acetylglucosamine transferase